MPKFTVQVSIECDTLEEAQQVIAERISPDEDYGFDYRIGYGTVRVPKEIAEKLQAIRQSIEEENISYGEIIELQGLAAYIGEDDEQLREWAGIPEFDVCPESEDHKHQVTDGSCDQCGAKNFN